ncbi:chemotaxis protein CheD [Silvimonas iriomotensis]|uniref:Probable chemoreceptor glutamine deamidase CheD n=1 Tax=Silvimonas iriomotensis TaxID=449662 RepID=A0ABQ2PBK4_9NEIS|nr:chemotaxis protein CheD [Silvimonas iriomotensis]GGP22731.1 putative chemoreceptor glutamine deamidase CheD [Silvimonas iriomotensis]
MSERVFVNPGEIYFGQGNERIETLLGSCVAITFWHPARHVGGMCHFLLPNRVHGKVPVYTGDGRYGDEALQYMIEEVAARRTRLQDYQVKVFGGGRIFANERSGTTIGESNVRFALSALHEIELPVAGQDVAGEGYRYLRFDLTTGDVWVRRGRGLPATATPKKREPVKPAGGL